MSHRQNMAEMNKQEIEAVRMAARDFETEGDSKRLRNLNRDVFTNVQSLAFVALTDQHVRESCLANAAAHRSRGFTDTREIQASEIL